MARVLDRDEDVLKWLRPAPNEFNITYNRGKRYEPDFVVETASVSNISIDELDKESFDIFRREALRSGRMSEQDFNASRQELLEKLGLLTDDGKLTRAGGGV